MYKEEEEEERDGKGEWMANTGKTRTGKRRRTEVRVSREGRKKKGQGRLQRGLGGGGENMQGGSG